MARSKASSIFKSSGPADTARLAGLFAGALAGGDAIFLEGPIGAGKTFFVRELAAALGAKQLPVSASFNLMRAYKGRLKLYHFDLFRAGEADMENIGLEDYLGRADGVTAVEWPEAAGERTGAEIIKIEFALAGGDRRVIKVYAGAAKAAALAGIGKKWLKK
ncbi:MAG: tRNA (adenosine(37)-N6)-threonylcarbamoyltransferase complex ATPase subunit type 1 TsaE [Elusimicrobiales bacterium]|nr:tRNA (adenosine(37)-N6)-threonylcarbamoyltransferase complex ATPase subunit type 1 TsaE [Elusimicrobiales bacterium]